MSSDPVFSVRSAESVNGGAMIPGAAADGARIAAAIKGSPVSWDGGVTRGTAFGSPVGPIMSLVALSALPPARGSAGVARSKEPGLLVGVSRPARCDRHATRAPHSRPRKAGTVPSEPRDPVVDAAIQKLKDEGWVVVKLTEYQILIMGKPAYTIAEEL